MSEADASDDAPEGGAKEPTPRPIEVAPAGEAPESAGEPGADAAPESDAVAAGATAAKGDTARATGLLSVAFLIATAVTMAVAAVLSVVRGPQGPWRGEYYENQDFEGESTIRYARKIEFDFKKGAPFRGMPKDHWSVTWTTCMNLEEATEFRFRLSSDDGTRLYINDDLIVDNWGAHATRTRTGRIELEPGSHHVKLEYFEDRHGANVKLLATIDDGEAETIPPAMLSQPADSDTPCG